MSQEGRFILINGILCRTADDTGTFCPSDVFSGYDPGSFLKAPQSQSLSETLAANLTQEELQTESLPTVNSSCPLYRHFSVLSGGVLINTKNNVFLDFTDPATYHPIDDNAVVDGKKKKRNCTEKLRKRLKRVQRRADRNAQVYRDGCLEDIKAEAVLALLSSVEPIGTRGTPDTPLTAPNTYPKPLNSPRISKLCAHNMRYVAKHSVLSLKPRSRAMRKEQMRNLKVTELLRLFAKVRENWSSVIPNELPFRAQANGARFLLCGNTASKDDEDDDEGLFMKTTFNTDGHGSSPSGPSFASSFVPLLGYDSNTSKFVYGTSLVQFLSTHVTSLRLTTVDDVHSLYVPHHAWAVLRAPEGRLLPPPHLVVMPFRQLEWVFKRYFAVMGVKETVTHGVSSFTLSPDAHFSAADAVSMAMDGQASAPLPPEALDAIRSTTSRRSIRDVWFFLFEHSRTRIVRRLNEMLQQLSQRTPQT
ncbi:hypothetical protein STCU_11012 [Strigomonas culicis]|uniref:Uncharacterized protein n=1 Tax=Strigomonas culicis TaxID=28005 RepID=S9V1T4_9TRYP|nr:hypothetical protein STCU_11012 [Strigomonas culicis]|eukprot:EPY16770.1 hypothetical protein STCU_11012 [Strigomonas culicis]